MSDRKAKTMQGQEIDLAALALQNEHITPVGNAVEKNRVEVPSPYQNVPTRTRRGTQSTQRKYNLAVDEPVMDSKEAAKIIAEQYSKANEVNHIEGLDEIEQQPETTSVEDTPKKEVVKQANPKEVKEPKAASDSDIEKITKPKSDGGGLASAIAKAKEVKQEPMKTQREEQRSSTGVKRI